MADYIEVNVYEGEAVEGHGCSSWDMAVRVIEQAIEGGFTMMLVFDGDKCLYQLRNEADARRCLEDIRNSHPQPIVLNRIGLRLDDPETLAYADLETLGEPTGWTFEDLDAVTQTQKRPRYAVGQTLLFNDNKLGIVKVADTGGALGVGEHSYDLFVEAEGVLYKHVPESKVTGFFLMRDR